MSPTPERATKKTPERARRRWKPRTQAAPADDVSAIDHREAGRLLPTAVMTTLRRHPAGEAANPRSSRGLVPTYVRGPCRRLRPRASGQSSSTVLVGVQFTDMPRRFVN